MFYNKITGDYLKAPAPEDSLWGTPMNAPQNKMNEPQNNAGYLEKGYFQERYDRPIPNY